VAAKASRNGRKLIYFVVGIAVMYGLVAAVGDWKPRLGLDLQGGTRITLQAETPGGEAPTESALEEATAIIDQRVNGSGVTESEVSTQGDRNIVVEIPGQERSDLVDAVSQTAQLRFRLVSNACGGPCIADGSAPTQTGPEGDQPNDNQQNDAQPNDGKGKNQGKENRKGNQGDTQSGQPEGRAVSEGLLAADGKQAPGPNAGPTDGPSPSPSASPAERGEQNTPEDQLAWMNTPGQQDLARFDAFTCPAPGEERPQDVSDQVLIACDEDGNKFLLSTAVIEGTQLDDASSGPTQQGIGHEVRLSFNGEATDVFADISGQLAGDRGQFAIVLDGEVISNAGFTEVIPNGEARITGDFNQAEAASLATSLKYGALPLKFTVAEVSEEGPTLAGDQLSAGLIAGALGLGLVLIYCLAYYRGLGLVVVGSLLVAAAITYAVVLLLAEAAGFALTLPGIAGLIVGVGITADSFIVYFERIRDEMREGKSMRVAVESGWVRARNTCLAADAVSLLAAVVLYIFAIGVVKGFAFALGISTIIDVVVFFLFTKPMVSWLASFRFFYSGHKLSGLSPEHVGIERIGGARPAGGVAR
jgi:preprotein translocase subunit SecD